MSSSADAPLPPAAWRAKYNSWLIAVVVAMAGSLGSSNDESAWVMTSYLVSNAVVLPISGWLAGLFGRKRFLLVYIFYSL